MDSEQPGMAWGEVAAFYSLYGHFDPTKMDSGFGRIRSRVRFGCIRVDSWIPESESANPEPDRQEVMSHTFLSSLRTKGMNSIPIIHGRSAGGMTSPSGVCQFSSTQHSERSVAAAWGRLRVSE